LVTVCRSTHARHSVCLPTFIETARVCTSQSAEADAFRWADVVPLTMTAALYVFVASIVSTAAATWLTRRFARRFGIVHHPNEIVPPHTRPIARLGGLGIAAGTAATVLLSVVLDWAPGSPTRVDLMVGGALFLALGVVDDLSPLAPLRKLTLETVAAAIVVGLRVSLFGNGVDLLAALLAVCWIVTLVQAVSIADVCDGLVAGLACIQFFAVATLMPADGLWGLAITGSCLGFLFYNAPAASIALGGAGSRLLGFWLAALTLDLVDSGGSIAQVVQALLVGGVPLLGLVSVITIRIRNGLPWRNDSSDHFALRLQAAGFSRWATDGLAWTAMLVLAGLALQMK
jgi:UDP-GlcNAc:undecaprenyl-phosphate GlcNAc-1-phosphate transferase